MFINPFSISWDLHLARECTQLRCRHGQDLKADLKENTRCEFYPLSLLFIFWYMLIIITAFQDGGSYHRPNKNNSDHLVIDSWTDEDNEKAQATQQHMGKYLF